MDGNLLAGIFDAREKVEEWRKTPLPDTEPSIALTPEGDAPSSSSPSSTPTAPATSAPVSKVAMDHNMGDLYTVAVCGVVKKTDGQHMLSKSSHVEFGITVTRLCDGASRTVYRRFREIKQFYYDLIGTFSEIEFNKHIKFPMYDSWLSSSSSDPHSELVVRRKVDLQVGFGIL